MHISYHYVDYHVVLQSLRKNLKMTEKIDILKKIVPVAVLKAMTEAAEQAVPQTLLVDGYIPIRDFPFRVGRESRVKIVDGRVERVERVKYKQAVPTNDLYLIDDGHRLNISREHLQIEQDGGKYYVFDRGSACGTLVGDVSLNSKEQSATVELKDGDTIVIGTRQSPYVYTFIVLDSFAIQENDKED